MRFAAVASAVEAMMQESVTDGNPESRCKRVDSEAMSRRVNRTKMAMDNSDIQTDPPSRLQVHPTPPGFKRLPEIQAPTLIIFGDQDVPGMQFVAQQLHTKIHGSSLVEIPGADHIVNMSKPSEFNQIVQDFLRKQA